LKNFKKYKSAYCNSVGFYRLLYYNGALPTMVSSALQKFVTVAAKSSAKLSE
jgi:hypothetical protein